MNVVSLKRASTPGPWVIRFDSDEPYEIDEDMLPEEIQVGGGRWRDSPGTYNTTDVVVEADTYGMEIHEVITIAANAELMIAFSRSIDPILSILWNAHRLLSSGLVGADSADIQAAAVLARSILDAEQADD